MNLHRLQTALSLMIVVALISGCSSDPIEAPASYEKWNAKDGTFLIEYPQGWEADGGGRSGIQWARFKYGDADIHVSVKFSDSVIGDIVGGGGPGVPVGDFGDELAGADELAAVDVVHASKKEEVAEDFSGYEEKEAVKISPPLGDGRKSEFTTSGFTPLHGYRATILNKDRGISVICRCAESDWETLKPAFDRILNSIARGSKHAG